MKYLTAIVLLCTAASASAETWQSPHGYALEIPEGWEPVPPVTQSSTELRIERTYASEAEGIVAELCWIPGRGEATDLVRLLRVAVRNWRAVETELGRTLAGGFGAARIRGVDTKRRVLSFETSTDLDGEQLPVFMAMQALEDGVCLVIVHVPPNGEALHAPTFDRVARSLTVTPGRDYVPNPRGPVCTAVGLLLLVGLCVPVLRRCVQGSP